MSAPTAPGPVCSLAGTCETKGSVDILVAGVGGQGILLLSRVIGDAAIRGGVHFVMSEVHGMAQRGGVVTSHVRLGKVYGPLIAMGCADVIVAMEPIESLRALDMAGPKTTVISTTRKVIPFTVGIGGEEYPALDEVWKRVEARVGQLIRFDATELAAGAGAAIASNVVLLGALTGTRVLPMDLDHMRAALEGSVPPKLKDINLDAFARGYGVIAGERPW